jgi:hypothetical protein
MGRLDDHPEGAPFAWSLLRRIALAGSHAEELARERAEEEIKLKAEKEAELAELRGKQDARLGRRVRRRARTPAPARRRR